MRTLDRNALQIICVLSFSVLCAAATYACLELGNAARRETVTQIDGVKVNSTIDELKGVAENVKDATGTFKQAEAAQLADYDPKQPGSIPNQIYRLIEDTKTTVGHTDANLNGGKPCLTCAPVQGFLPALTLAANHTVGLADSSVRDLDAAAGAITDTQAQLKPILEDSARASDYFYAELPLILKPMAQAAENTATITTNGSAVSYHVEHVVAFEDKKITAPVRKIVSIGKGIENNLGDFFGHVIGGAF